jgi:hypothetical protein
MKKSGDRGFLGQLMELMSEFSDASSVKLTSLWDENHIALDVSSGLVVLAVGDFPREVRDEKSRVEDPANSVVQNLGRRESLMAALVRQDPDTGSKKTLKKSISGPKTCTNRS